MQLVVKPDFPGALARKSVEKAELHEIFRVVFTFRNQLSPMLPLSSKTMGGNLTSREQEAARWQLMLVLRPGEELIWYDRPPAIQLARKPALSILFMLGWTALALFISLIAFRQMTLAGDPSVMFAVFLVGVALSVFGLVVSAANAWQLLASWRTFYGLTDRRLIIVRALWPGNLVSLRKGWLESIRTTVNKNQNIVHLTGKKGIRTVPDRINLYLNDNADDVAMSCRSVLVP